MNFRDLVKMALQNLWARKSSTAFNIFGIVVSCSMLLLVFAGTRGARDGLLNLFSESELAKQFAIRPGRNLNETPKASKSKHEMPEQGIAVDRKRRIREQLNKDWQNKNYPLTRLTLDRLNDLRGTEDIASVMPIRSLRLQMTIDDRQIPARVVCTSASDCRFAERIVYGTAPNATSQGELWIDEYRAYRLGFRTDEQLKSLIGRPVRLRFQVASATLSPSIKRFAAAFGISGINETEQLAETFGKLLADLDQTDLDDIEKETLRMAAERLGLDSVAGVARSKDGQPFVFRDFKIAGIVHPPSKSASTLFRITSSSRSNDLIMHWRDYQAIEQAAQPERVYNYCVGSVENASDLRTVIDAVEASGFETRSAIEIIDKADEQLGRVRLIVGTVAVVILLIACVGIMNSVIIAVMQRTPEFGVMKAIGATDADIRNLVLVEAFLTGLIGALVSVGFAFLIDAATSQYARQMIETRIDQSFDFRIFVYSTGDILLIGSIAIGVSMFSSLLPSRRVAKLDPVVAMK